MKTKRKLPMAILSLVVAFCLTLSGSAFASNSSAKHGNDDSKATIDAATAVTMIVKGLGLNIDDIRFFKEPKASDYFTKVKDNAPYAGDFIIAQHNGLGLPKDIDPAAKVTREQFSVWLYGALSHKGDYAWIEIFAIIKDAKLISKTSMDAIQKLLIAKIVTLDGKGYFYPKSKVTVAQAKTMIARTAAFIQNTKPIPQPEPPVLFDPQLTTEKETDAVTKVTLSVQAPHAGYGVVITGIKFDGGTAYIQYKAVQPDPDKIYAQVITELKVVTYVASSYKVALEPQLVVDPGPNGSTGFPIYSDAAPASR
ncbi:S-layer homology domain-containing protein [Cohnella suwonensis]|uniref:S-layer homology domain-containing protein n=1 Tax=Cohnella suwonensis TaxID=696072 RepID=A0ABW0LR97_9BACL